MPGLTISDIREYQERKEKWKDDLLAVVKYRDLGREIVDKFNLTYSEAAAILNNKSDEILEILERQEQVQKEGSE